MRMLWGAFDWQHGTDNPYGSAQTVSGGTSAAVSGGIGVRRVEVTIDRATTHAGADPALVHFDFLNMTSGAPDDTWTTGDYTTLEGYLNSFFTSWAVYWHTGYKVTTYNWYRVGAGVTVPNPAQRQLVLTTPIAGSAGTAHNPPQVATSVTFRTAVRRSWGRTYMPMSGGAVSAGQVLGSGVVDTTCGYVNTLVTAAASSDFHLVVMSKKLSAALTVEKVEVDDVYDVVRRRRWKSSTYKKILP